MEDKLNELFTNALLEASGIVLSLRSVRCLFLLAFAIQLRPFFPQILDGIPVHLHAGVVSLLYLCSSRPLTPPDRLALLTFVVCVFSRKPGCMLSQNLKGPHLFESKIRLRQLHLVAQV